MAKVIHVRKTGTGITHIFYRTNSKIKEEVWKSVCGMLFVARARAGTKREVTCQNCLKFYRPALHDD
jgi:hypothetical protein